MEIVLCICFGITCFLVGFLKLTEGYINPYKLIMVFGKKGSGKTTFLTKVAIRAIAKGQIVYSTIEIPGTRLFNVNDIGKFTFQPNSIVLIDEVGMIWDNRNFKSFREDVRDFFKFQRQYKLTIYLFSQTFDVDLKLRNLTDEMYLLRNRFRVWSVARRIDKRITIQKAEEGKASSLVDDYQFAPLLAGGSLIITFIPRWVKFFNSYDPTPLPFVNYKFMPFVGDTEVLVSDRAWKRSVVASALICIKSFLIKLPAKVRRVADNFCRQLLERVRSVPVKLWGVLRHPPKSPKSKVQNWLKGGRKNGK